MTQIIQSSSLLKGKTIVLGITGSIAAVRCAELALELRRHGASVHVVMAQAALSTWNSAVSQEERFFF